MASVLQHPMIQAYPTIQPHSHNWLTGLVLIPACLSLYYHQLYKDQVVNELLWMSCRWQDRQNKKYDFVLQAAHSTQIEQSHGLLCKRSFRTRFHIAKQLMAMFNYWSSYTLWTVDCGNGLLDLPKPSEYTWNTLARPSETISLLSVLRL